MYLIGFLLRRSIHQSRDGSKACFNCIIGNTKLIQHRFIKSFVFQLGRISGICSKKRKGRLL